MELVDKLPIRSNFVAVRRGGMEYRELDEERYLQIGTFNVLQQVLYATVAANSKSKVPKPKPWPMPHEKRTSQNPQPGGFEAMIAAAKARRARKIAQQTETQQTEE